MIKQFKRIFSPNSLKYQLFSKSLFILAVLLLLIGGLQFILMKQFMYRNQAESLNAQLRSIPWDVLSKQYPLPNGFPDKTNKPIAKDQNPNNRVLFLPYLSLTFIDPNGKCINLAKESNLNTPCLTKNEYKKIETSFNNRTPVGYQIIKNEKGVQQLVVFQPFGGPDHFEGIVQMGIETTPIKDVLLQQLLIFGSLSLLALAGGLALYIPSLRRTLVPLNNMVTAVERTNAGNLTEHFPVNQGQEEIDRLAESFNNMLKRLETSFKSEREAKEQMRRFIADASHELRTPLTSIHGFLEVLLRGAANKPEQLNAALNSMLGESTRIKKLIEDLLLLAKLDRAPEMNLTDTRLDELMTEMEPQLRILAGERNVHFDLTANIKGMYDPDKIKQIILNLFQNAVQHTDATSGSIKLSLVINSTPTPCAEIIISDNGPGIDESHLPHLFERFYRSESSRARKYGGAGLGLSITQSIVEAHGGNIIVKSVLGEGSTFIVRLPI
ncbi:cell wall metabolism sensor histidine kinase WalK [Bacillus sp. AFS017336]|uniref:sensor histidine kinase n=1 Tax=Bacillus sp. AFS017336 TaxID=2033489 RepID=UPI000BF1140D|nr:HAMP domain-containing sensor histidine kinase [Bacillus sp. AFS017336]PEL11985.1 two-component sensor histidine kinase [Bacillus sp. AFS017336]